MGTLGPKYLIHCYLNPLGFIKSQPFLLELARPVNPEIIFEACGMDFRDVKSSRVVVVVQVAAAQILVVGDCCPCHCRRSIQ